MSNMINENWHVWYREHGWLTCPKILKGVFQIFQLLNYRQLQYDPPVCGEALCKKNSLKHRKPDSLNMPNTNMLNSEFCAA